MDIAEILLCVVAAFVIYFIFYRREITYFIEPSNIDVSFAAQASSIMNNSPIRKSHNIKQVFDRNAADIQIMLAHRDELVRRANKVEYYPGTQKRIYFSYTWQSPKPHVKIDHLNWLNGVAESRLTLQQYRQYVIQHEFMHALGYDHQPCNAETASNGVCPILYQSTRGCPAGFKCGYQVTQADYGKKLHNAYFR